MMLLTSEKVDSHVFQSNSENMKFLTLFSCCMLVFSTSLAQQNDEQSTTGPEPTAGTDIGGHQTRAAAIQLLSVIPGVPAYNWFRGCGPTSLAMVLAYYDSHGFPGIFPGDASSLTPAVQEAVAGSGHYNDYSLPLDYSPNLMPDKSELPAGDEHSDNCIADYMFTSRSAYGNYWGWSWSSDICPAFQNYLNQVGSYSGICNQFFFADFGWNSLMSEIDGQHPLMALVDTDGDNYTDHFITVTGYKTEGGINYYGCYHTWDQNLHWYEYRAMGSAYPWSVSRLFTFRLTTAGIKESLLQQPARVWPVPFEDRISIIPGTEEDCYLISLSDLSGRRLFGYRFPAEAEKTIRLGPAILQPLKPGMYILTVQGETFTEQRLIQKSE